MLESIPKNFDYAQSELAFICTDLAKSISKIIRKHYIW